MTKSLEIVIPVLNEEKCLPPNVQTLCDYLGHHLDDYRWHITIVDNGSTDSTPDICKELMRDDPRIGYLRLEQRGRGRALRQAWLGTEADIVGYMDVDLSTDLDALPALVDAVDREGFDIAIGSRLKKGANVIGRGPKREFISRCYSVLFRSMFLSGFQDAQCGFKVLSGKAAQKLVPLVKDTGWFFDTELLILGEKNGYRIKEVPVKWTDDPDSRVKIVSTAIEDIKGLLRLRFGGLRTASKELSKDQGEG